MKDNRDDGEEEEDTKANEKADLSVYDKLRKENGKAPSTMFFSLLQNVFDEDMQKVDDYFEGYLFELIAQKKLKNKDFSEGISKFVQLMPELGLDLPQIHAYLMKHVIKPLLNKSALRLSYIQWSSDAKPAGDDDDYVFDQTDSYYKLMALILQDYKQS